MEFYKIAIRNDLRFTTPKGVLSLQEIWQLSLSQLAACIKSVRKLLKEVDDEDDLGFLTVTKTVDIANQLRFDILKDVYMTKKKEEDEARDALSVKQERSKILALIADKKDENLKKLSVEELEAMLKG